MEIEGKKKKKKKKIVNRKIKMPQNISSKEFLGRILESIKFKKKSREF